MKLHSDPIDDGPPAPGRQHVVDRSNEPDRPRFEPADVSTVRIAQREDIEGIMALSRLMHAEVGLLPFDEDKVRAAIVEAVQGGLVGVTGYPDVCGCMCLNVGEAWYTRTRQINEFMFFVHPDHRKAGHARSLLAWGKFMGDGVGMPFFMGVFGEKRTAAKIRLCERHMRQVGAAFMHYRAPAGAPDDGGA